MFSICCNSSGYHLDVDVIWPHNGPSGSLLATLGVVFKSLSLFVAEPLIFPFIWLLLVQLLVRKFYRCSIRLLARKLTQILSRNTVVIMEQVVRKIVTCGSRF